jgi:3-dehydroquinate synthase
MKIITVRLAGRSYPIFVGTKILSHLAPLLREQAGWSQLVLLTDTTVAGLHLERVRTVIPGNVTLITIPAGELSKSLAQLGELFDRFAEIRLGRRDVLLTFGGGVVGDLGGFAAATWHRGIRYLQIPTTLEAAVDASIGGKTGINHAGGKNLIGAFHQPSAVLIDTDFFATLGLRDLAAGLAESIKHAALTSAAFLDWHEQHADAILARDPATLAELVARNCEIKADVVCRDEREADVRRILNYGHTIGHAIEHLLAFELRHGECVGLGMLVENEIAHRRGLLPRSEADRVRAVLARFGLPLKLPQTLDAAAVLEACRSDKKAQAGHVPFALIAGIGQPQIASEIDAADVKAALRVIDPNL